MKLRTLKLSLRLAFLAAMLFSLVSLSSPGPASASYCSHLCENHCTAQFWACLDDPANPYEYCCTQANQCLDACGDCPRWCF
jgi:hypothetical protein